MYQGPMINAHAHIYPEKIAEKAVRAIGKFYHLEMRKDGLTSTLLAEGDSCGVSRSLVHSTATAANQVRSINRFVSDTVTRYPDKLIGFGTLHMEMEAPAEEIDRMEQLGLRGVKMHPDCQRFHIDDPRMMPIYERLEGRMPVLMHTGDDRYDYSRPHRLAKVSKMFPHLLFIAAHFGGYRRWEEVDCYEGCANIYFDTCSTLGILPDREAVAIIRRFGAGRFLFGTDFPMWDLKEELEKFYRLGLSEEEERKILFQNAAELLRL